MPIPFLLAGAGILAGVVGVGGHIDAKETNEIAQARRDKAKNMYDKEKDILEKYQEDTKEALLNLGYAKEKTLNQSMKHFLTLYEKIKDVNPKDPSDYKEISRFSIDDTAVLQIKNMSDIYFDSIGSGVDGAATGSVIALAANGSLGAVTSGLSLAGTFLSMGEVGSAVGMVGSALSVGAAMTPLAAVAAPVVMFTGISASMKADENLEKANEMLAKAEKAVEEMKVSEVLCKSITERSKLFQDLLRKLDRMFAECVYSLDRVIREKEYSNPNRKLKSEDFTQKELELISVTRALAGATKAVIDTPILTKDGKVEIESRHVYDKMMSKLSKFDGAVKTVK